MSRFAFTGVLAALMVSTASHLALASDADVIREYRDRGEIEALMWRYTHALDTLNEDAYAAVYTPDGSFAVRAKEPPSALKRSRKSSRMSRSGAPSRKPRERSRTRCTT